MSSHICSLPFSNVFDTFIVLRSRAVAASKSGYILYSVRAKLCPNFTDFVRAFWSMWQLVLGEYCDSALATAGRACSHQV